MDVLIGTTNPAKISRFTKLLSNCSVRILSPKDFSINEEPVEDGRNPIENAQLKAAFYSRYCPYVICNDSGLYFKELAFDDPLQPGLHIRTPNGRRLNDEEMITYYAALSHSLGGKVTAYYLDAIAVCADGTLSVYKDSEAALQDGSFYLLDTPSPLRTPGWPLDSLSVHKETGIYFVDSRSDSYLPETRAKALADQRDFLMKALRV